MSIGIIAAALVATCTPAAENPADLAPTARSFFEEIQARDYAGALKRVAPGAIYATGHRDSDVTIESLLNDLVGSDNVSRLEVVDIMAIPDVVAVRTRLVWPEDGVDVQISVLSFDGGCISFVRDFS